MNDTVINSDPVETTTQASPQQHTTWYDNFPDDLKGYVQDKDFKDPQSVVNSYLNLEKLMGYPVEQVVKIPAVVNDNKDLSEVYQKLGRPENADGYNNLFSKEHAPEFLQWGKETFFEMGLNPKQAQVLLNKINEYSHTNLTQSEAQYNSQIEQQERALKSEWGLAYDQNVTTARKAVREFGLNTEAIDALESSLGHDGTMKLLHSIGAKLGEGDFVTGEISGTPFSNNLTPTQAIHKINMLRHDNDFIKRYSNGDNSAKEEMERLHRMAYPQ